MSSVFPPRPLRVFAGFEREVFKGFAILSAIAAAMMAGGLWSLLDGGLEGVREHPWRWALVPLTPGGLLTLLGLGGLLFIGRSSLETIRRTRACAEDSEEVWLEVVSIALVGIAEDGKRFFQIHYRDGRVHSTSNPLLVEWDGRPWLVVLRPSRSPHELVVPLDSLYPFSFTEAEAAAIRSRLWAPQGDWPQPPRSPQSNLGD